MSRKTRELRLEAQERWPNLYQFLACYLHQDWTEESSSPETAVDLAVSENDVGQLKKVALEWCSWNVSKGIEYDLRPALNDGLGVEVWFEKPEEARAFMNTVYDKIVVEIRKSEKGWKP